MFTRRNFLSLAAIWSLVDRIWRLFRRDRVDLVDKPWRAERRVLSFEEAERKYGLLPGSLRRYGKDASQNAAMSESNPFTRPPGGV